MPLQQFVDEHTDLTIAERNAIDPPPSVDAAQEAAIEIAQSAVDDGCDPAMVEEQLAAAISYGERTSGTIRGNQIDAATEIDVQWSTTRTQTSMKIELSTRGRSVSASRVERPVR